jgi:hypothetical protein
MLGAIGFMGGLATCLVLVANTAAERSMSACRASRLPSR